eukprot:3835436-Rhodomonas_salina.2
MAVQRRRPCQYNRLYDVPVVPGIFCTRSALPRTRLENAQANSTELAHGQPGYQRRVPGTAGRSIAKISTRSARRQSVGAYRGPWYQHARARSERYDR